MIRGTVVETSRVVDLRRVRTRIDEEYLTIADVLQIVKCSVDGLARSAEVSVGPGLASGLAAGPTRSVVRLTRSAVRSCWHRRGTAGQRGHCPDHGPYAHRGIPRLVHRSIPFFLISASSRVGVQTRPGAVSLAVSLGTARQG